MTCHEMDEGLDEWVDGGTAPERLLLKQHAEDGKLLRTRWACPHPQVPRYREGDPDQAESFDCIEPGAG